MREGTASATVITHFLKLASEREKLERVKLERENKLLAAKSDALQSAAKIEEMYEKAITAMRSYSAGVEVEDVQ